MIVPKYFVSAGKKFNLIRVEFNFNFTRVNNSGFNVATSKQNVE